MNTPDILDFLSVEYRRAIRPLLAESECGCAWHSRLQTDFSFRRGHTPRRIAPQHRELCLDRLRHSDNVHLLPIRLPFDAGH
jgi:hypothetical protein